MIEYENALEVATRMAQELQEYVDAGQAEAAATQALLEDWEQAYKAASQPREVVPLHVVANAQTANMSKATAQTIIDDLVSDIADILNTDPRHALCVWWRGRLSGVVDTVKSVTDVDLQRADAALNALHEAEEIAAN